MPISNNLLNSSSPYLQKHAYSPIQWYPWSAQPLTIAEQEDKPILLSIGYSACHWCEVMHKDTFEDLEVAALMNQYFIAIKVDREERPDIDKVYMLAVQAMGLHTGWPLHVFLLPNQEPFYGGTYFANTVWKNLLLQIAMAFQNHRAQLESSAIAFTKALYNIATLICKSTNDPSTIELQSIQRIFHNLYQHLDLTKGGITGEPKFPMPSVSAFLHTYYLLTGEKAALAQFKRTLTTMACAGIYDQLGGGFARYATDAAWNIPHFEKMLYDNAQLISLYAKAYVCTQEPLYKDVLEQTIAFLMKDMYHREGGFYSAIAANSAGEEGRSYTWTIGEVIAVLGDDYFSFVDHYPIIPFAASGNDRYIFTRQVDACALQPSLQASKQALFAARSQRLQPEVDQKVLTAWNAMMIQALLDTYYALREEQYMHLAYSNTRFIQQYLIDKGNTLKHGYYQGKLLGSGYLEDYTWVVRAWISLYQITLDENWLLQAVALVDYAVMYFGDSQTSLLHMAENEGNELILNPIEVFDESLPSANAVMAHNLFQLGILWQRKDYLNRAKNMLESVGPLWEDNPVYLASWAHLYTLQLQSITVAILGAQCNRWVYEIKKKYPDVIVAGTMTTSSLPLLQGKAECDGKVTSIYICHHRTCLLPLFSLEEVFIALSKLYSNFS